MEVCPHRHKHIRVHVIEIPGGGDAQIKRQQVEEAWSRWVGGVQSASNDEVSAWIDELWTKMPESKESAK
jgi:hypothetical protein